MAHALNVTFKHQEKSSRLWALLTIFSIKGLLLIPHMIVLLFLEIAAMFVAFIGVWAVLFTGRYPVGMENFLMGVMRWAYRMFAYYTCMTDKYPPFTLQSVSDYPADLSFQHQPTSSRLLAVITIIPIKYILLIPHIIVLCLIEIVAAVCMFLGIIATLILGRYPQGFEKWIVGLVKYGMRITVYFLCLTDKYPPFTISE